MGFVLDKQIYRELNRTDAALHEQVIDETKHYVLRSAHPSPFSADRGFFGSRHFSKANAYLRNHNLKEIDW